MRTGKDLKRKKKHGQHSTGTPKNSDLFGLGMRCGLIIFLLMGSMGIVNGCTVFTASSGDTVLFGNNEDVGDKNVTVWIIPATEGRYGWVCFRFRDYPSQIDEFPMGGMNDQGLCFDITSIPKIIQPLPDTIEEAVQFIEESTSLPSLTTFNPGLFGARILETCATVEEAIQNIEQYDHLFYGEYQFLFTDRTGDSMILCPDSDGEMKIVRKKGMYQAITNFNVLNPNLGHYPCERYENAVWMLKEIEHEEELTVNYFTTILQKTHGGGTTYSTIYDPVQGEIYLFNHHNFGWGVVFNVEDELQKGYHSYEIQSLMRTRGEPFPRNLSEPSIQTSTISYVCIGTIVILITGMLWWKWRKKEKEKE
ncbi:MAG: hypothetical protein HXS47_00540 [Theionarchaea archaeon]|nr:hypothetical protein [Theionarchaea archaeon]